MSLRELRRHVGRLAIIGFDGHTVPDELRRLVAEFDLGGVIYFARNIVTPQQVADLSREVADLEREWPFWISVDQEGGRVARLRDPFTVWPPAVTLGRSGDESLAQRFASALATELLAVGINLDFAPVLDILTNPSNPVIGDRALSDRAEVVARMGSVIIRTLQAAGIAACGKHFPGHGDTTVDSHEDLPIVEHDRRRLEAIELVPFRQAVADRAALIMTAHMVVAAVDEHAIASFSRHVVHGWLKSSLGYDGVVVSDDLGMKAVSASTPLPEAAVRAIEAGCDTVLLCNCTIDQQAEVLEELIRAAELGRLTRTRLDDAFHRQRNVKARLGAAGPLQRPGVDVIGTVAHQNVAREMARWV